ncbi:putative Mbd4, methyl-CpG binding domain protein 4 [Cryphonectria parasitica EP155]|uniref:Mbd4, methyl-CpG binding domain protein 4 n=1 Tax=Cryphonectria parasitica (strain ATCC 38755 / EP155) TaxID=660469 RepID=A0A9P5CS11_CRYP1|nr:putative Mbd4, methyl-CpG binding domain protein 4 [Cryphonectria parasitica EP155]KAF3768813.1 putative Mbd4, methyl-CpG binding domain protein 4 [Cryphonectria parasitica EP155]
MSPSNRDPDADIEEPPREKRRSRKDKGDKTDKDRDRESRRHHKHRTSNPVISTGSYVSQSSSVRRHKTRDFSGSKSRLEESDSMTDLVPELNRSRERVSIPYPSFSKAHSREAVGLGSKEDVSSTTSAAAAGGRGTGTGPPTPEATDIGADEIKRSRSADFTARRGSSRKSNRPPSPPETNLEEKRTRAGSLREKESDRPRSRTSAGSRPTSRTDDRSKVSLKSRTSSQATFVKSPTANAPPYTEPGDEDTLASARGSRTTARTTTSKRSVSGQTLRPPEPVEIVDDSPESAQDSSSPKTPTIATPQFPPPPAFHDEKHGIPHHIRFEPPQPVRTPATDFSTATSAAAAAAPPPPPPPPPLTIQEAPRVDYLMQNGGLPNIVPKNFLAVLPRQTGTRPSNPPLRGADVLFAPFYNLLDNYQTVLNNSGSIAVATGHRTVARRLLDRLENVFNRDLPEEGCSCIMCERSPEPHRGLGWGEVLERVSGRVEIPSWPPFDIGILGVKAREDRDDLPARPSSPVKMDPDIAEEFREHYLQQSKKVKMAVDKWLTSCAEAPAPPPQEVDDETLTFAILTSLDQEDRPFFNALLTGSRELQPALRAPTPLRKPRADFVIKSGLALQRLYRLSQAPRDAEVVCYLVKYPQMHDLLSTICDINPPEWEILISGRFDGFLWSGAEDDEAATPTGGPSRGSTPNFFARPPSRGAAMSPNNIARHTPALGIGSRNATPFSRGATPASFVSGASSTYPGRHPVSNDEESEIAVLAELEREIYLGMEALEDAFEGLHQRAEMVRTALRQRGAGLSMNLQHRRGYGFGEAGGVQVLPQSGGSASGLDRPAWADESESLASESDDWGMGDEFELRPDDSASNISSSRQRRPRRRDERRTTPAPIREEDEG